MDKTKNVFISHHRKDEDQIEKLKTLLAPKGYQLKNSSIDTSKRGKATSKDAIRRLLRMRISWSGTFICLVGTQTAERSWVDWEIKNADRKDKSIIGVFLNGGKENDVPEALNKLGDSLVTWRADKIIGAIEGSLKGEENWCAPNGNPREGQYSIPHETCS
ncbi:MAG: TIR domain-containing protein [Balneolales bacterium]